MSCKEKLEQYLRSAGVPFEAQIHPAAYTARQVAATEHLSPTLMAKVVVAYADEQPVMLVVPANARVDLYTARVALGASILVLAREDQLKRLFPDCDTGAMPPFGNLYGLPVYVDEALTADEQIVFQVGSHTETFSMRYADYRRLVQPHVLPIGHEFARTHTPFSVAGVVGR